MSTLPAPSSAMAEEVSTDGSLPAYEKRPTTEVIDSKAASDKVVTLVTASGTEILVHSAHLANWGPVFQKAFAPNAAGERTRRFRFSNASIADDITISLFVEIIYGRSLPGLKSYADYQKYSKLILFCKEYQVLQALDTLRASVVGSIGTPNMTPFEFVMLGVYLDDPNIVKMALRAAGKCTFGSFFGTDDGIDFICGASMVDLSAWSWTKFKAVPDKYKFALIRAIRWPDGKTFRIKRDWDAVAERFATVFAELN